MKTKPRKSKTKPGEIRSHGRAEAAGVETLLWVLETEIYIFYVMLLGRTANPIQITI